MEVGSGLWQIFVQTDIITKLVLLVMFIMSLACWTYFFYKLMLISIKMKSINHAQRILSKIANLDEFIAKSIILQNTFAGDLVIGFFADFKAAIKYDELYKNHLSEKDWDNISESIYDKAFQASEAEERSVIFLSTSAQSSPLFGLFGTVWGLIHAFLAIGQQKGADIGTVAPGIAEALITTLGGLVVAIPSLIMYSYMQSVMSKYHNALMGLGKNCLWSMKHMDLSNNNASSSKMNQEYKQHGMR